MAPQGKKEESAGFKTPNLDYILANAQYMAHKHFPDDNSVKVTDTFSESLESRLPENQNNTNDRPKINMAISPVSQDVYHGFIEIRYSNDDDPSKISGFLSDIISDMIGKIGYGCFFNDDAVSRLNAIFKETIISNAIGLQNDKKSALHIGYNFSPHMLILSAYPEDNSSGNTIEYSFSGLSDKSTIIQRGSVMSVTETLDGRLHPASQHIEYDDSIEVRSRSQEMCARVDSMMNYVKFCIERSEEHYMHSRFDEAGNVLSKFIDVYNQMMEDPEFASALAAREDVAEKLIKIGQGFAELNYHYAAMHELCMAGDIRVSDPDEVFKLENKRGEIIAGIIESKNEFEDNLAGFNYMFAGGQQGQQPGQQQVHVQQQLIEQRDK